MRLMTYATDGVIIEVQTDGTIWNQSRLVLAQMMTRTEHPIQKSIGPLVAKFITDIKVLIRMSW